MKRFITYRRGTVESPMKGTHAGGVKLAGTYTKAVGGEIETYRYLPYESHAQVSKQSSPYSLVSPSGERTPNGGIKPAKPKFVNNIVKVDTEQDPCLYEFMQNYPTFEPNLGGKSAPKGALVFHRENPEERARENVEHKRLSYKAKGEIFSLNREDLIDMALALEIIPLGRQNSIEDNTLIEELLTVAEESPEVIIEFAEDEYQDERKIFLAALKEGILLLDNDEGSRIVWANGSKFVENKFKTFAITEASLKLKKDYSTRTKLETALEGEDKKAPNLIQTSSPEASAENVDLQELIDKVYTKKSQLKHTVRFNRYFYVKQGDADEIQLKLEDSKEQGKKAAIEYMKEYPKMSAYLLAQVNLIDE